MSQLQIKDLHVSIEGKKILKGINLNIKPGEIHTLMGPNGSGKSTLASTLMGHPNFRITKGTILLNKKMINTKSPDDRAQLGLFLSFQYPVEIAGLSFEHFLRQAYNTLNSDAISPIDFRKLVEQKMKLLRIKKEFMERYLNEGYSGGEKKKSEILQMAVLQPKVAILDETDSGLDVDALKDVAQGINKVKTPEMSILLITHYYRILKYIKPDKVHIMVDGRIVKSGGRDLATRVENNGYNGLTG
ncbi:Fe-S cluster assembly ATPase SufC [Patescibacteria group bacterium]|nr:Fe-S cluster assembly ATPase SufC [Patescibacteria group bacterium]MBU0964424.1 Fe-S cluster assembly ATPase SufC [Patescibacteria group bacterium]